MDSTVEYGRYIIRFEQDLATFDAATGRCACQDAKSPLKTVIRRFGTQTSSVFVQALVTCLSV